MPTGIYKHKKIDLDMNHIRELYVNERKTAKEIAKIMGVSDHPIYDRLKEIGIKRRESWEGQKINIDLKKIKNLYVNQRLSTIKIAKIFGVSRALITDRLIIMGIKRRGDKRELNLDVKKIIYLYVNKKKTIKEIGKLFGVSTFPIQKILKEERIKTRPQIFDLDMNGIKDLYVNKQKSIQEISKILKVSNSPICRRLIEMNIKGRKNKLDLDENKIRELYLNQRKSIKEIAKILNISTTPIYNELRMMEIEVGKNRLIDKKKIKELYLNQKKSSREIAKIFGVGQYVILSKLEDMNIKRKNIIGAKGKLHPNWQNGKSFEPYGIEFNKELKEKIRKRDNHTCQECGKTEEQLKRKLSTHHINYCKTDNRNLNLISLCDKCHAKTNYNRKHWTNYFQMKMFIREFFNPENLLVFENKKLIGMSKIE